MPDSTTHAPHSFSRLSGKRRFIVVAAATGLLGAVAGAGFVSASRPTVAMAPVVPVAIRTLASGGIVTVRGQVAEIYGNKFVLVDASGRALIDTGPGGDERALVTVNEPVTVQGRFDRGALHAAFLVGPDRKVIALEPIGGPPHGPGGPHGPDHGPAGPPPPPPPMPAPVDAAPAAPGGTSPGIS